MLWLVLSFVVLILLLLFHFINIKALKPEVKQYIMGGLVAIMLLFCVMDQVTIPRENLYDNHYHKPSSRHQQFNQHSNAAGVSEIPKLPLNISEDIFGNHQHRQPLLNKDERVLMDYLLELHLKKQPTVLYVENIDEHRFKTVVREFQLFEPRENVELNLGSRYCMVIDFNYHYTFDDIQYHLSKNLKQPGNLVYIIPENVQKLKHLSTLEHLYLSSKFMVSIIMSNGPDLLLPYSSLFTIYSSVYKFSNNYVPQLLENHPAKLVEICNKYRVIDYEMYRRSKTQPLAELCSHSFPSNQITDCIKKQIQNDVGPDVSVPYSKVKHCWKNNFKATAGIIVQNGRVKLKKDYYYAGKVDPNQFAEQQYDSQNL